MQKEVFFLVSFCIRTREDFEVRGADEDLINLRFKHFRSRLLDTINAVLQERRQISKLSLLMINDRGEIANKGNHKPNWNEESKFDIGRIQRFRESTARQAEFWIGSARLLEDQCSRRVTVQD